jgi:hypothetical protein
MRPALRPRGRQGRTSPDAYDLPAHSHPVGDRQFIALDEPLCFAPLHILIGDMHFDQLPPTLETVEFIFRPIGEGESGQQESDDDARQGMPPGDRENGYPSKVTSTLPVPFCRRRKSLRDRSKTVFPSGVFRLYTFYNCRTWRFCSDRGRVVAFTLSVPSGVVYGLAEPAEDIDKETLRLFADPL